MDKFFQTGPIPADQLIGIYNIKLVIISYIIAIFASYVALDITARLKEEKNTHLNNAWLFGGSLVMGAGIWSMHFVGMLAFSFTQSPHDMGFSAFWTILSLIIAIFASGFALYLFQIPNPKPVSLIIASIFLGVAITSMHYTGMEGMRDFVSIHYLPGLFILSGLIAIIASGVALWLVSKSGDDTTSAKHLYIKLGGALILGSAICGMHYTGMAAAVFTPSKTMMGTTEVVMSFDQTKLAIALGGAISLIMCIALGLSIFEKKRYGRDFATQREMLNLSQEKLRLILEACADGIVVLNERYEIEICSASFCNVLRFPTDALVGKKITHFLKMDHSENAFYKLVTQPDEDKLYEAQGVRSDGHHIPLELAISKVKFSPLLLTVCSIRDISERKKTDQLIELRHELMRLLAESLSLNASIPGILKKLCEKMGWDIGIFWKLDAHRNVLHCTDIWSVNDERYKTFIEYNKTYAFPIKVGLPGSVWASKKFGFSMIANDNNFPRKEQAMKNGIQSTIAFPILNKNVVVGVIECLSAHLLDHSETMPHLLQVLGEEIGIIVEREEAHESIALARQLGMAEVANSVIHNIGNVLNSVNVSVNLLLESPETSYLKKISKAIGLLQKHANNIDHFIDEAQGRRILDYLTQVMEFIEKEEKNGREELQSLQENIEYIRSIIISQQVYSGASGLVEITDLTTIIESAINIYKDDLEQGQIEVIRQYDNIKPCFVDCVKLMQILVNLIGNAKDALLANQTYRKQLIIRLALLSENIVEFSVIDNGCGIAPKDLPKIFSYGFTTKVGGHGFGLHSILIAAKEMDASVSVQSDGLGKGASFILQIPYKTLK